MVVLSFAKRLPAKDGPAELDDYSSVGKYCECSNGMGEGHIDIGTCNGPFYKCGIIDPVKKLYCCEG